MTRVRAGSFPKAGSRSLCTTGHTGTSTAPTQRSAPGPPVREIYLTDPLQTPDMAQWQTEICWPLAPASSDAL
jgi:hypothetical protein